MRWSNDQISSIRPLFGACFIFVIHAWGNMCRVDHLDGLSERKHCVEVGHLDDALQARIPCGSGRSLVVVTDDKTIVQHPGGCLFIFFFALISDTHPEFMKGSSPKMHRMSDPTDVGMLLVVFFHLTQGSRLIARPPAQSLHVISSRIRLVRRMRPAALAAEAGSMVLGISISHYLTRGQLH